MAKFPSVVIIECIIKSSGPLPDIPSLEDVVEFDHEDSRIFVDCNEIDIAHVIETLSKNSFLYSGHEISVDCEDDFWDSVPDDCVGGMLRADGWVSVDDVRSKSEIIPISEPFYIHGRPDSDAGRRSQGPQVLGSFAVGGVPLLSDQLLETVHALGAQSDVADIIYRGANQAAYDTVQEGFKRVLVQPVFNMENTDQLDFDVLPSSVPDDFSFCSLKKSRSECEWYEFTASRSIAFNLIDQEILLQPIFKNDDSLHNALQQLDREIGKLQK